MIYYLFCNLKVNLKETRKKKKNKERHLKIKI